MVRKKSAKEKSREYYYRARGTPEHLPSLTVEEELLAHEKAREVIDNWRAHHEASHEPIIDPRPKLILIETGRTVLGSAAMSEEEWREIVDSHPSAYKIIPPLGELPDV